MGAPDIQMNVSRVSHGITREYDSIEEGVSKNDDLGDKRKSSGTTSSTRAPVSRLASLFGIADSAAAMATSDSISSRQKTTSAWDRDYSAKGVLDSDRIENGEYGDRADADAAAAAASKMSVVGLSWDEDEGGLVLDDAQFDAIDALARKLESSLPPLGAADSLLHAAYVSDADPGLPFPKTIPSRESIAKGAVSSSSSSPSNAAGTFSKGFTNPAPLSTAANGNTRGFTNPAWPLVPAPPVIVSPMEALDASRWFDSVVRSSSEFIRETFRELQASVAQRALEDSGVVSFCSWPSWDGALAKAAAKRALEERILPAARNYGFFLDGKVALPALASVPARGDPLPTWMSSSSRSAAHANIPATAAASTAIGSPSPSHSPLHSRLLPIVPPSTGGRSGDRIYDDRNGANPVALVFDELMRASIGLVEECRSRRDRAEREWEECPARLSWASTEARAGELVAASREIANRLVETGRASGLSTLAELCCAAAGAMGAILDIPKRKARLRCNHLEETRSDAVMTLRDAVAIMRWVNERGRVRLTRLLNTYTSLKDDLSRQMIRYGSSDALRTARRSIAWKEAASRSRSPMEQVALADTELLAPETMCEKIVTITTHSSNSSTINNHDRNGYGNNTNNGNDAATVGAPILGAKGFGLSAVIDPVCITGQPRRAAPDAGVLPSAIESFIGLDTFDAKPSNAPTRTPGSAHRTGPISGLILFEAENVSGCSNGDDTNDISDDKRSRIEAASKLLASCAPSPAIDALRARIDVIRSRQTIAALAPTLPPRDGVEGNGAPTQLCSVANGATTVANGGDCSTSTSSKTNTNSNGIGEGGGVVAGDNIGSNINNSAPFTTAVAPPISREIAAKSACLEAETRTAVEALSESCIKRLKTDVNCIYTLWNDRQVARERRFSESLHAIAVSRAAADETLKQLSARMIHYAPSGTMCLRLIDDFRVTSAMQANTIAQCASYHNMRNAIDDAMFLWYGILACMV